ncbi:dsDNA-binding protein pdcd5, partial [Colletotrichum tofieldiae]
RSKPRQKLGRQAELGGPAFSFRPNTNTAQARTQIPTNMDDSELEQIRKARLEQLKAQGGAGGSSGGGSNQKQQQQEQKQQQEQEARQQILNQILHPEAADRLGRIRLVKEQRAQDVENRLIMLAQSGQLRSKVTETQLKELLSAVADNKEEEKIVVSRRKGWDDDDDDLLDL